MRLESVETFARRLGALGALAFVILAFLGLWQSRGRRWGQESGAVAGVQRGLSTRLLIPVTLPALAILVRLWRPIPIDLPRPARALALALGSLLYFAGLGLMIWGRLTLGRSYGVTSAVSAQLYADHDLVTAGPFAYTRNPMYVGGQLAEIGALLLYRTWTTALACVNAPVLPLRARREEEALQREFGPAYDEYAARVPFWWPRVG